VYFGTRRVWRARVVPVPPSAASDTRYDSSVTQYISVVRASSRLVAFVHVSMLVENTKCRDATPPCMTPVFTKQIVGEAWAGPPRGAFHRITHGCAHGVAVDGTRVAVVQQPRCTSQAPVRVVVVTGSRSVTVGAGESVYAPIGLAGRYVAWAAPTCPLTLRDLVARRTRYCLAVPWVGIAVAPDGTVAAAGDSCRDAVAWIGLDGRRHVFHVGADAAYGIRIAHGRIAYARRTSCTNDVARLVVVDLRGRRVFAAQSQLGLFPFDFDGDRVAYVAADGIHVASVP
jgi:hypothetical protein